MNKTKSKEQSTEDSIWKKNNKDKGIRRYFSVININVNKLNSLIKKYKLSD
jgi:hypothetical protein